VESKTGEPTPPACRWHLRRPHPTPWRRASSWARWSSRAVR
jgi:hypothetical protein